VKKRKIWPIVVACVCLLAILLIGRYYLATVREDMTDQAINDVLAVTQQQEQAFTNFLLMDKERVHSFANYFTSCASTDEASIVSRMQAFLKVNAIYTVANKETGGFCNNKINRISVMTPEQLAVYRTFTGSGMRESYIGLYDDTPMFGYYESFYFSDGVEGVFLKGYEKDEVSDEFSLSFYNGQGYAFVTTKQGDVLVRSVGSEGDYAFANILESINSSPADKGGDKESKNSLLDAMAADETGVEIFSEGGTDYVYTYVPVRAVDGWYLVSIVPLSAIMDETDEVIHNSQVAFFTFSVVLCVFSVVIFFSWRYQRSLDEKEQLIDYKEQQFNLLNTFLSENTDDVYIMMGKTDFRVEFVSPNIERVLGIPREDVLESIRALGRASYKDGEDLEFADLAQMLVNSSIGPLDTERTNPITGERKWFRETLYDVQLQDQEKIVAYISDRTAEQKIQDTLTNTLEDVRAANKAKTTFLSSMSHDIRTPMNAIVGLITLIKEDVSEPERVLEYANRMDSASHHLLELINNILDMNKIESGSVTLTIGELNLPELVDSINTIIRPQAKAKKQEFKLWASGLTNEHLLGDSSRVSQILLNLLSNAVKYTQEGGTVELTVRELPQATHNYSRLQFIVKDNGQGMSEDYLKVIFDPFTREQNTFTNKIQGTGLGMAITKTLVDMMGGSIQVESAVGKGSTFTVELELRIQDGKDQDGGDFWGNYAITRMIVADDDPFARESVLHAMKNTGVEVHYAEDGDEAVRMIREGRERGEPYDLILLDWRMPRLDGLETARLIRKNYPLKIPILFFTAYDWSDIEDEAREIGISHFLPKPFFMSTFRDAIRRVMHTRGAPLYDAAPIVNEENVLEGKHILVAEDIEVNRLILDKILSSYHATCDMAENGQVAVDKFAASQPGEYDMIFMDVQMPVMNGYEATRAIRACSHPEAKTVPIIAMTANAFADDVREALESGMDAHVSKPIVIEQMKSTISMVLTTRAKQGSEAAD